jgi:cholesterol transport system auxiliary component
MTAALSRTRTIRRLAILSAGLLVSACSILPKSETLAVYQLPAAQQAGQASTQDRLPASLRIATPHSSQITDSTRILVVPQGSQISAYSGARWTDPAPVLLRNRLAGAFRDNGQFNAISLGGSGGLDTDFRLIGDLTAFQVVYENGAPVVHIRYDASLVQSKTNRSIATRRFAVTQAVQGKDVPQVVDAFGAAADRLAAEVVPWTLQQAHTAGQ